MHNSSFFAYTKNKNGDMMNDNWIIPKNSRLYDKTTGFSFFYYVILFLFFSFIGWVWEVILCLFTMQSFVNRGILMGPWLPIYGAGGLLFYFLLYRLKQHPIWIFLLATAICSVLEYFVSWFLEKMWNIRWWDYSDAFLNLDGRICFWCSIGFGAAALLVIYVFIPFWEKLYEKIPSRCRKLIGTVLLLLFIADAAYAAIAPNIGTGITS